MEDLDLAADLVRRAQKKGADQAEVYLTRGKAARPRKGARCVSCSAPLPPGHTRLCPTCAARPDPFVGTKVENYRIMELIGRGGMAAVYKAEQEPLARVVALKILMADPMENKASYDRFLRGAKLNGRFDHPNIVSLYDAGFARGICFLAMEYVEGESLQDKLDRTGKLPRSEAVRHAVETASALDCLHSEGTVHRDVKPANILLAEDGRAKLADMGIAKELTKSGLTWVTSTGLGLGTLHYMAPEQMEDAKRADARSDLYALGATLYVMLAGRPPFEADSTVELVRKVQEEEPVPLSGVPKGLETLVWRLLRKKPAERVGSAKEVIRELS